MQSDDSRQIEQGLFIRRVIIVIALTGLAVLLWQLRDMLLLIFGAVVVAIMMAA